MRLSGLGAGALALSACGFTPVLAPGGAGRVVKGNVRPAIRVEGNGDGDLVFALTESLEHAFGPARNDAPWRLAISASTREEKAGRLPNLGSTRRRILGKARWQLVGERSGKAVAQGEVASFVAYDLAGTPLAERVARRDAFARLGRDLGARIAEAVYLAIAAGDGAGSAE